MRKVEAKKEKMWVRTNVGRIIEIVYIMSSQTLEEAGVIIRMIGDCHAEVGICHQ